MASKQYSFVLSTADDQLSTKRTVCRICGDKASIVNYGVLSCSSCKTFFRRHGFNIQNNRLCLFGGNCPMTVKLRRNCTACRLAKCLAVGMSPDLIRKEDLHEKYRSIYKTRKKLIIKNSNRILQPCSLNLLSNDQSSLTSTNWRLFSNVVHAFDTYNSVPNTRRMVNLMSSQPNVENSLSMMGFIYTALQSFVNCIADFRIMTTSEQCSLLQRNMRGVLAFYCVFVFRESGVFHNHQTENAVLPLYGYHNVQITKFLSNRLEYDATLVKLMIIGLIFSSNCFTVSEQDYIINDSLLIGTFRLFGSQNVYIELLWKYMLYRYGFYEAVLRFDGMIKIALDSLRLCADITDRNELHREYIDDIADQCQCTLKLNGPEETPLWGK